MFNQEGANITGVLQLEGRIYYGDTTEIRMSENSYFDYGKYFTLRGTRYNFDRIENGEKVYVAVK